MKILLLGSGGREHALGRALAADPAVELHAANRNPGLAALAALHAADADSPTAMVALATELGADLVVVGPEAQLVAGVADALREAGFAVEVGAYDVPTSVEAVYGDGDLTVTVCAE